MTDSLVLSLIQTAHAIEARIEEALDAAGLSMAKFAVLDHLAQAGVPLTLSELAAKSACVRSNMTQLMDRLEADGLVRRMPDAADRRVIRAELTDTGAEKHRHGAGIMQEAQAASIAALPEGDRASLRWALRRLG